MTGRAVTGVPLLIVAFAALLAPQARAADTVIDFEPFLPGTTIQDQYKDAGGTDRGVRFGISPAQPGGGAGEAVTIESATGHGLSQSAAMAGCNKEFCAARAVWARFPFTKQFVRAYVGGGAQVRLTAFNASGQQLAQTVKTTAATAETLMEIVRPTQEIVFFKVEQVAAYQGASIKLDDLTFDNPTMLPPPDFGLSLSPVGILAPSGEPGINQGATGDVTILVNRVNNASGNLAFKLDSPLPGGVSAQFLPSATNSASAVTLRLTASQNAQGATNHPVKITATPTSTQAGSAPRSLEFSLNVFEDFDLRVTGIEVTQGIQSELARCFSAAECDENVSLPHRPTPTSKSPVAYQGVRLVRGKKTIARVFANVVRQSSQSVKGVEARLYGFDGANKPLPGSPILYQTRPTALFKGGQGFTTGGAGMWFTTFKDRVDPKGSYNFALPDSWTSKSKVTLRAELEPPLAFIGTTEAECDAPTCFQNNRFTLKDIGFEKTGHIDLATARLHTGNKGSFPQPGQVIGLSEFWFPLADGELRYNHGSYYSSIDVSEALEENDDRERKFEARDILEDHIDDYPGCETRDWCADTILGLFGDEISSGGVSSGQIAIKNAPLFFSSPVTVMNFNRRPSIAHELAHGIGREHSDRNCGGEDGGGSEDWPPDNQGLMHGIGYDIREVNGRVIAPGELAGGFTGGQGQEPRYFDYMSYCHYSPSGGGLGTEGDGDRWTSVLGQNKTVALLRLINALEGPFASAAGPHLRSGGLAAQARVSRARQSAVPLIRVQGLALPTGEVKIKTVKRAEGSPERMPDSSAFTAVVRDAAGGVVATTPMIEDVRDDPVTEVADPVTFLSAEMAAAGAASVELVRGGVVVASRVASAATPRVRVRSPRAGQRVGRRKNTVVRWRATDADGGKLRAKIDYSDNGGRRWRPIHTGPNSGRAALPSALFSRSRRARLRIRVNDDFNEGRATSKHFVAIGRRPDVTISSPRSGTRVRNDASLYLAGRAVDDRSYPLTGRRLRWLDGRRLLGRGGSISVSALRPGRHTIRLVARDRFGRTGSARVKVRLKAAAPRFLRVKVPTRLRRKARRLTIRLSSTIPATLRVSGKRVQRKRGRLSRRLKPVAVRVKRGSEELRVRLRLSAGGKKTIRTLRVARR